MNLTSYPRLAESLYTHTLPNGLRIRVVPKKDFARKYAFLAVDFGSIDTKFSFAGEDYSLPAGIAHYLEHKMFDLPDVDANARFAELGASANAFTSYSMTAYHFSCTENFPEALELLLRMVTIPYFTEESVEKERGIIEQEICMYEDNPESCVYEDLFRILFPKHPASIPIAGSAESISHITAEMLYDCHKAFYTPANMILTVAGDVDPTEILSLAEKFTPAPKVPLPLRDHGDPSGPTEAVSCSNTMTVSMPTFAMAFRCPPVQPGAETMKRELIGELASEILGGESSPLFARLYREGLIDASFSVGYESIKDLCLLSMGGDSDDPKQCMKPFWKRDSVLQKKALTKTGSIVCSALPWAGACGILTVSPTFATGSAPTSSMNSPISPSRRPMWGSPPKMCRTSLVSASIGSALPYP